MNQEELLVTLVKRAHADRSVASASMLNGVKMLVYPLEQGILIGVGLNGERAQLIKASRLLHKRAGDMPRFGSWLPIRLMDGSWYVVKRVQSYDSDLPVLNQSELDTAEELLS